MLLMPASDDSALGIKVLTIAGPSAARAAARIQGLYLLFDNETLAPTAILDGPALTTLRTPAVSIAAVLDRLTASAEPLNVVVFGAGPQAIGHVHCLQDTLADIRPLGRVTYLVRRPVVIGGDSTVLNSTGPEAEAAVGQADVIVCATTSSEPLLASEWVRDEAVVIAVGSHDPASRELDSA